MSRVGCTLLLLLTLGFRNLEAQTAGLAGEPTYQETASQAEWTYTFRFNGIKQGDNLEIRLPIPEAVAWNFLGDVKPEASLDGRYVEWVIKHETCATERSITFTLAGPRTRLKTERIRWRAKVNTREAGEGQVNGPKLAYDPSLFRPVFGAGSTIRAGKDFVDFEVKEGVLLATNDSRPRTAAIVGGAFKLGTFRWLGAKDLLPVDAIVSLEFQDNTTKTLDGFLFGVGVGLQKYLSVAVGFSLNRGTELSPGFERAAALAIKGTDLEKRFPVSEDLTGLSNTRFYDGLPLTLPGAQEPFYSGGPIIQSFNKSFFIGIVVPLEFRGLLGEGGRE